VYQSAFIQKPARKPAGEKNPMVEMYVFITIQIIGECEFNTVIAPSLYIMVAPGQKTTAIFQF
jgi:hypothetical protein